MSSEYALHNVPIEAAEPLMQVWGRLHCQIKTHGSPRMKLLANILDGALMRADIKEDVFYQSEIL